MDLWRHLQLLYPMTKLSNLLDNKNIIAVTVNSHSCLDLLDSGS